MSDITRREFLRGSATASSAMAVLGAAGALEPKAKGAASQSAASATVKASGLPNLSPAQWLWYPSERCLQNTFVLFRRELVLPAAVSRATGWIAADSRYLLEVNGKRVQWGPAPADPRWPEADPVDLAALLREGPNVLGAKALFYGQGDGTWPVGKPGFLFWLEIELANGEKQTVVSDATWKACLAHAWEPGHYKRWYLRSLQEEFDARLYPYGWSKPGFMPNNDWLPAMPLDCPPNKPPICSNYSEYMLDISASPAGADMRPRSIPMMRETLVPMKGLVESSWLEWRRSPEEYFAFQVPDAFQVHPGPLPAESGAGQWRIELDGTRGAVLTFEFAEQVVGWPCFTIEAPAGAVVELLVHEAHQPGGPVLLNTHFNSWTRFKCLEGENRFETFDFESFRWVQLHIHNCRGTVTVRDVGARRRQFPWPHEPQIRCSEPALQRLIEASINTLHNCAQETCVDGMARERQQYSGDCGHQLHAIYLTFGETRLPARYLATFSQGLTADGYFLDCWPAYDRLARLMERELQLTGWGPILDHSIGFGFDCWHHYLYTGDLEALREAYPRLLRFTQYLRGMLRPHGLLPVENLGVPSVWMDHAAFQRQRHKQCAFNLYAAVMLQNALAPICRAFGDGRTGDALAGFGGELIEATIRRFWSNSRGVFVNNLPWLAEEKNERMCDRSLATAVLFDLCPGGRVEACVRTLVECPPYMGFSYPANAGWRLWALAKAGRADTVLDDLRSRWATMDSVKLNNTLQEDWRALPDSGAQWSHCAVAPLYVTYMSLAGLRPLQPGFKRVEIRPQLANLDQLELAAYTVLGPIRFSAEGAVGNRSLSVELPAGCEGELVLRREESVSLDRLAGAAPPKHLRYRVPGGRKTNLTLRLM